MLLYKGCFSVLGMARALQLRFGNAAGSRSTLCQIHSGSSKTPRRRGVVSRYPSRCEARAVDVSKEPRFRELKADRNTAIYLATRTTISPERQMWGFARTFTDGAG